MRRLRLPALAAVFLLSPTLALAKEDAATILRINQGHRCISSDLKHR